MFMTFSIYFIISSVTPNIGLFASRLNYKLKPFVAFKPDPEACAINAFSISWSTYSFTLFHPLASYPKYGKKFSQTRPQDC